MRLKLETFPLTITLIIMSIIILWNLTGCFTTDKYHNKKHIDTMKKDIQAAHRDFDRVLGLDEPSPLVEE